MIGLGRPLPSDYKSPFPASLQAEAALEHASQPIEARPPRRQLPEPRAFAV